MPKLGHGGVGFLGVRSVGDAFPIFVGGGGVLGEGVTIGPLDVLGHSLDGVRFGMGQCRDPVPGEKVGDAVAEFVGGILGLELLGERGEIGRGSA